MEYYVYVKLLEDNVKKIAKSRNVKGFRLADVDDFRAGEIYSVYWEGDKKTRVGYYDAKILHMSDSKEEMDAFIADKAQRAKLKRQGPPENICRLFKEPRHR
ncbi:uncharacterized protein LOC144094058 isoform X2 [Amblyomma americanum]